MLNELPQDALFWIIIDVYGKATSVKLLGKILFVVQDHIIFILLLWFH